VGYLASARCCCCYSPCVVAAAMFYSAFTTPHSAFPRHSFTLSDLPRTTTTRERPDPRGENTCISPFGMPINSNRGLFVTLASRVPQLGIGSGEAFSNRARIASGRLQNILPPPLSTPCTDCFPPPSDVPASIRVVPMLIIAQIRLPALLWLNQMRVFLPIRAPPFRPGMRLMWGAGREGD